MSFNAIRNIISEFTVLKLVDGSSFSHGVLSSQKTFNPLWTRNPKTGTLGNSEDPDEMPHNAAFHQGLQCLLKIKSIFRERNTILIKNM